MQSSKLVIPTIKQAMDVVLEVLPPQPRTPGSPTPITNLCVIGNDVPGAERDRLVQWPSEKGGGPYIYVSGPNPLQRNATLLLPQLGDRDSTVFGYGKRFTATRADSAIGACFPLCFMEILTTVV